MIDAHTGTESATTAEPVEEATGSLADHEAAHPYGALTTAIEESTAAPVVETGDDETTEEPGTDGVRDDKGRFQPARHRAKSQQATAGDVETIAALTKRIKEAEAADGTDIVQQTGESNRVFELRRRAELAERRRTPKPAAVVTPPRAAVPAPVIATPKATPPKPTIDEFADKPYEDFVTALADWTADRRWEARDAERQQAEAKTHADSESQRIATSWQTKTQAAIAKYPDFAKVALEAPTAIPAGSAADLFILEDESGADVLYHLQRHPDEMAALLQQSPLQQVKTLSLLAQRLTTPDSKAVTTGAAASPVSPPAPRPPTPVRTGPSRSADEPPPEDASLSAHERFYHKRH